MEDINTEYIDSSTIHIKKRSNIIPVWQFIALSICTLWVYELIRFYRTRNIIKKTQKVNIMPFWRAFFAPLWAGSITSHIEKFPETHNTKIPYTPLTIGVAYFLFNGASRLPDPLRIITYLSFIPMIPLVAAMNQYREYEEKKVTNILPYRPKWREITLSILGLCVLILILAETLVPTWLPTT